MNKAFPASHEMMGIAARPLLNMRIVTPLQRYNRTGACDSTTQGACESANVIRQKVGGAMDTDEIKARLNLLVQEHRDLDTAIEALLSQPVNDRLQVQRLKKRKLRLKDEIAHLHDLLVPDIIA